MVIVKRKELSLFERLYLPEVVRGFGANVAVFDRGWYGLHEVSRETLDLFLRNLETIRAGAAGR